MNRSLPLLALVGFLAVGAARADDWASWRGPDQNGVAHEKNLPDRFSTNPSDPNSNLVWKQPYGGRSTPIVMNGRVFIINDVDEGTLKEQERVMCFDAETGKVLWEHRFNVFYTDIVSSRVGWADPVGDPETGNVYVQGVQGLFICFDRDGKILWQHSLTEEYGRVSGYGGRITSPTVEGDLAIIGIVNSSWGDQARGGNRYLAVNKRTGVPVWWSPDLGVKGTYYSHAVAVTINGERLLVTGGSDGGVHALRAHTGEAVWSFPIGARALNSSPVVDGTLVYISHGEENEDTNEKGRVVCLDAGQVTNGKPKLVWKRDNIKAGYASPIIHEGRLYVCDDSANMHCLDAKTGKPVWRFKYGRVAKGSPVWADGKIYVGEVNATFAILKPGERRCEELYVQRFRSPTGDTVVEVNGSPAVANGKIYFVTRDEIYCIGKKDYKGAVAARPVQANPVPQGAKPAALQVVPADVVLHPGDTVDFKVTAFDAHGHALGEAQGVTWSLPAPAPPPGATQAPPALRGQINDQGRLGIAKEVPQQQGVVTAKLGNAAGHARVRVVPRLPLTQDFERVPEGRVPAGWVNCQGKFAVQQMDGTRVLKKVANNANPLVARAHTFIGLAGWTDYTIQCDLMGTKKKSDMPDMGIMANRYSLVLDGNKQRLRLMSWEALPRVDKAIGFAWQPSTWYRMKFTVEVKGDKALVRGKVWEREKEEPNTWSIEFEDPAPNKEGSPGLYGYATGILETEPGTEIFYDNVKVTPNGKK